MRLLHLYRPHLPLELARARASEPFPPGPLILGGRPWDPGPVIDADPEARALGVRRGMPLGSAHRLVPEATFIDPAPDADRASVETAFEALAAFSPGIAGSADPVDSAFGLFEVQVDGLEPLWGVEPVLIDRLTGALAGALAGATNAAGAGGGIRAGIVGTPVRGHDRCDPRTGGRAHPGPAGRGSRIPGALISPAADHRPPRRGPSQSVRTIPEWGLPQTFPRSTLNQLVLAKKAVRNHRSGPGERKFSDICALFFVRKQMDPLRSRFVFAILGTLNRF